MNAPSPSFSPILQSNGLKSLWDMYEIGAQSFVNAIQSLANLERILPSLKGRQDLQQVKAPFSALLGACRALSANLTVLAVNRLIEKLEHGHCTTKQLEEALVDIRQRFKDELYGVSFLILEDRHKTFFNFASETFGFDFVDHFSSAVAEEIDEAGKCLALDCNTACVFHLMRAMEESIKIVGTKLGVENVEKEWGKILSDLAAKIEAMPKGSKRDEWSACHVNLYHVKQAWRNSTMHPKKTYTPDQAMEVFDSVRAFMRHLTTLV